MPKNNNIKTVLIIGSGPIVIGQACEFDYSGTQAALSLREEGIKVILINSNPATIMTDPMVADKVYLLPLTVESIRQILSENEIDAVIPTMGGQTALNLCKEVNDLGIWKQNRVQLLGINIHAIEKAEDREQFRRWMVDLDIPVPIGNTVKSIEEGNLVADQIGFPLMIRPSFTLGGSGGSIVEDSKYLNDALLIGLTTSPIHEVLIEKAVLGWKEFELEVLKDAHQQVIVIATIENIDPMGIHTGDSVTVCPAMTLSDRLFQKMRNTAIVIMQNLPDFSGGCNVQFAIHPSTEELLVIEINPRVSRSSALASKATGYPIAKIAAKLALGYRLDELKNPITKNTSAFFEPAIDYTVVKAPKWNFEKFKGVNDVLGPQMKSVGEVMGIGRSFAEALQKAWHGTADSEEEQMGFKNKIVDVEIILKDIQTPKSNRLLQIKEALFSGASVDKICHVTNIDPWFVNQIKMIADCEKEIATCSLETLPEGLLLQSKQLGISDERIAALLPNCNSDEVYDRRIKMGIKRVYKSVDTCSAEFEAPSNYFYSTFEKIHPFGNYNSNESEISSQKKIIVIGSGPNKIGQGIEFDYCCVHGALGIRESGYEAIMVNCNPETVSTDFDISDKLYFEPLTWEYLQEIIEHEKPEGVILQLGGQTSLKFAHQLAKKGIHIFGTSFENIDKVEDRVQFSSLLKNLKIPYPRYGTASNVIEALEIAHEVGYPVLLRPSYVLGGQRMTIVANEQELKTDIEILFQQLPKNRIIIDQFLDNAREAELDAIYDGEQFRVMGVMEQIEPAGIHSGDSHSVMPPYSLPPEIVDTMENYAEKMARHLNVKGLINIQFAIKDGIVYMLEANPRASRTVPFISKVYNVPYLNIATKIMIGALKLADVVVDKNVQGFAIKIPVFSFHKFLGTNQQLGPEMKSTGETILFFEDMKDAELKNFMNPNEI